MQVIAHDPQPITVEQLKLSRTFDFNLEALRGIAALLVVWHHAIYHKHWLDPSYTPDGVFSFNPPGHLSVIVFFVLSGYVIGRVHILPLTRQDILPYLKKRFVRIYPIYFVTMLIAYVVARGSYPISKIIGDLTIVPRFTESVIFENNPAWSLPYEITFYLLFIPLSFFRLNVVMVAAISAIIGITAISHEIYDGGAYALGFAFWLCGVMLARRFQRSHAPSFALMVSMLLLLVSLEQLNFFTIVLAKLAALTISNMSTFAAGRVQLVDIAHLPYCIMMILVFTSREVAYKKYIIFLLMLAPACSVYTIVRTPAMLTDVSLVLPVLFYFLAVIVYVFRGVFEELCSALIHQVSRLGALSYGLYMIHFPIIAVFARIDWFSGTALTSSIRFLCYIVLCLFASYALEKKLQPWIKQYFFTGQPPQPVQAASTV